MSATADAPRARFRDVHAERAEASRAAKEAARGSRALAWPAHADIALCAVGFERRERELLHRLVRLSQRRSPRLNLLAEGEAHRADVIMIDGSDAQALAWSREQPWLAGRAVVWVNGPAELPGHTSLPRPIQWPMLPIVLARTLRGAPATSRELVARQVQPDAPMVMVMAEDGRTRERMRRLLDAAGCRVTQAATAREGLAALHAGDYACVLLAGPLKDGDAFEVCRRLRSLERRIGHLPVLMLDAAPGFVTRMKARLAGCDDIVVPPRRSREMRALLADRVPAVASQRHSPRRAGPPPLT